MKMRVQRDDGEFETIERGRDRPERTHSFDEDGYYLHTQPVAADVEQEAPPEPGIGGLEPTFA